MNTTLPCQRTFGWVLAAMFALLFLLFKMFLLLVLLSFSAVQVLKLHFGFIANAD